MKILRFNNLLFLALFFPMLLLGNDLPLDSTSVEPKILNASELTKYQTDTFNYNREVVQTESWWDAFKRWFWNWFGELFDKSGISYVWEYLQWLLIAAVIIFIVLRIFKTNLRGLFQSKSASNVIPYLTEDENIHEISFDERIAKAISAKNYREAIRLSFLMTLKKLADNDLIVWQLDKTNHQFIKELKGSPYKTEFKQKSILFEYIWYGEFKMSEDAFLKAINDFKSFNNKLGAL